MTTPQDTVAATATWLDTLSAGLAQASNYLAARAAEVSQTAAALRAIDWGGAGPPPPPPPKGTVGFSEAIGTVELHPTDEVVRMVAVHRTGSTKAASTQATGLQVSGPAAGTVASTQPASFGEGQANSHVAMRFKPGGAGLAGAPPLTGRAALLATDELDPGTDAAQSFTVTRGTVVTPPPANAWWKIPGGNLSGNPWNIGWNSTGWGLDDLPIYIHEVGRRPEAFCGANHPGAHIEGNWDEFHAQSQFVNSSGFGLMLKCAVKGKTWHILNIYTWPVHLPLGDLAKPGDHDAHYVQMGQALRATVAKAGLEDWQLALRINKEFNQSGYVSDKSQAPAYGKAVARFLRGVRQGYGMTSRGRLRATLSPARQAMVGSLESLCAFDDDGSCLFDSVSCSTHPASQLNKLASRPADEQEAGVREWLQGGYKPGYTYLNADKDYSVKFLVDKYNLAYSADEWSPRYEPTMFCAIGPAAIKAMHDFFVSVQDRLAWDCVYNANILREEAICQGWPETSRAYKKLWGGK